MDSKPWVIIQNNTFKNWTNEQLRPIGLEEVTDFEADFEDGVKLVALVGVLQGKTIMVTKKPQNRFQKLANVTVAKNAMENDNITLVNIGPQDIVDGNLKLILGLVWHLIRRYQIGKTRSQTMLSWLRAVIPECDITNLTTDWNNGIALHALIDWCKPGLCPNWRNLSRSDGLNNCRNAMMLAKDHFDIPLVVRPEDLASSNLDKKSCKTYLSYFMKLDSPGYHATLRLVRSLLRQGTVNNFTTDWNDGRLLCNLVTSVGGHVARWPTLTSDPIENLQAGIDGAKELGIEPLLSAKDLADPDVDHTGPMAYAAYFGKFKPVKTAAEKVIFSSSPSNVTVGQAAKFSLILEDDDVSAGDIRAEIIGPDSQHLIHFICVGRSGDGCFLHPQRPARTRWLSVTCEGQLINGCPVFFEVLADRSKVTFSTVERCSLGTLTELQVDIASAGQGEVQVIARSPSGRTLNLKPIHGHGGNYVFNFNPTEVGTWEVSVTFDGKESGSPCKINVYDPSAVMVYGLEDGVYVVGSRLAFTTDASQAGKGKVQVKVEHESSTVLSSIYEERCGVYKVDFIPGGAGNYQVYVYFNGQDVRGSPYIVEIGDPSNITVSGDGLKLVSVNKTASFEIHGASADKVNVQITSPSGVHVPCHVQDGENMCRVEYIPTEVGDYTIEVRYGDQEVNGSPYIAKADNTPAVEVPDIPPADDAVNKSKQLQKSPPVCNSVTSVRGLELQLRVDRETTFYVDTNSVNQDLNADIDIISPSGERVHTDVCNQGNGNFKVDWTPRTAGRHTVDIQYRGIQATGSRFSVDVFDLAAIRVDNLRNGIVGERTGFNVDFSEVGTLNKEIKVVGPSGHDVVVDTTDLGQPGKHCTYMPDKAGRYRIYIRYGGFELPDCPFIQEVEEGGLPTASGRGLYTAEEDKPAHFNIDVGRRIGDLRVAIDGPNSIAKCNVDPQSDGSYMVTYIPVETGFFDISVTWNGADIPGSPYHPNVLDARRVKVIGGWQHFMDSNEQISLIVGERKQLPFDVSEAGPGTLRAEVEGPSQSVEVDIDNHVVGRTTVEFTPVEEGNHNIHLFWSDIPLVSSPFLGYAVKYNAIDPSKLFLTGKGWQEAIVREEAEFVIDGSQAGAGLPEVVLSGVRDEVNVKVTPVGNGKFRCQYIPMVPGAYLLHITWNGCQMHGSPYKVNVIRALNQNKLVVSGDGLHGGILGQEMEVWINTRKAGPGELTVHCKGPNQVAHCDLEDNYDGTFRLIIKAKETGGHVLQIKYCGKHVNGSPFKFSVTSQPDASKVRVLGPGVKHGILGTFVSSFTAETEEAGSGELMVRVRGPKGGFQLEMKRWGHSILCHYNPKECGLYMIIVKLSGVDVPGSPFHVYICDTTKEMRQFLNKGVIRHLTTSCQKRKLFPLRFVFSMKRL